jgi:hypothetical protein
MDWITKLKRMEENPKKLARDIIIGFFLLSQFFYMYGDQIAEWAKNAPILQNIAVYILTNPAYIAIILVLMWRYKERGLIASILIVVAFDIQSLPHMIPLNLQNIADQAYMFPEGIIYKTFATISLWTLYVAIPTGLMIAAGYTVEPKIFIRLIKKTLGVD